MNNASLINQTSGEVEWFTPQPILEAARETLGGVIELDPASCATANERVKAQKYYTKETDGLSQRWVANTIWMNHPFQRGRNHLWIDKLIGTIRDFNADGLCITYACTSEKWFQPLLDFPQCYLYPRTQYLDRNGEPQKGATKGSVVTLVTWNWKTLPLFHRAFRDLGKVKL